MSEKNRFQDACLTLVSIAAIVSLSLLAIRGCENKHAEDIERIKSGQVYVRDGWVRMQPTPTPTTPEEGADND